MMVHDVGDFIMNMGKVFRDLELTSGWKIDCLYACIVLAWLYPRCFVAWVSYIPPGVGFVLPDSIYQKLPANFKKWPMPYLDYSKYVGFWFQAVMLMVISILNLYWIILIIGVGCKKSNNNGYIAEFQGEKAKLKREDGEGLNGGHGDEDVKKLK